MPADRFGTREQQRTEAQRPSVQWAVYLIFRRYEPGYGRKECVDAYWFDTKVEAARFVRERLEDPSSWAPLGATDIEVTGPYRKERR